MKAITMCLWIKTTMTREFGYFASYVLQQKQVFSFYKYRKGLGVNVRGVSRK